MKSDFVIHNTFSGQREAFHPLKEGTVSLYVCGITPYDETHLGHARCYVVFDVLKRQLQFLGYNVNHVQNFTDVDDRIIEKSIKNKESIAQVVEPYVSGFLHYMKQLNVLPANYYPKVTDHMPLIVSLIERLVGNGAAYESQGDVYFSVREFPGYGRLSKRDLKDLESGARVEISEIKKDPLDFALWKKAKPGEPSWKSPWGEGRPGWHIECSAMSMKYLGEDFDIHGGGLDLVFPHHENEVAQSVGATGKKFARYWMHNGFVTINKEKMSKSLGNFFSMKDILSANDPMAVRYFLLSQHYRSPLNFSDQELKQAELSWMNRIKPAFEISMKNSETSDSDKSHQLKNDDELNKIEMAFNEAMSTDLNTASALGELNRLCSMIFRLDKDKIDDKVLWSSTNALLKQFVDRLGLDPSREQAIDNDLQKLLEERTIARQQKNYKRSDEIRDVLKDRGYTVEDTPSGPRLKKLVS